MVSKRVIVGIALITILVAFGAYITFQGLVPEEKQVIFTHSEVLAFTSVDPCIGTVVEDLFAYVNLYEPLFEQSLDPAEVIPLVAREAAHVSPDGLKYTVKLREGVKFHDGSEVTAEDVVFTMDRALRMKKGYSRFWLFCTNVGNTKAIDKYTVEFNLFKPFSGFVKSLVRLFTMNKDLILAHIETGEYGEFGDYGRTWLEEGHDAGSGAYYIVDYSRDTHMEMHRFEDYWQGWKPNQIDVVRIVVIKEEATTKFALVRGDIDMTNAFLSFDSYAELEKEPGIVVDWPAGSKLRVFHFNTKRPPTDDIHVRRAIAYAFDYAAALDVIWPHSSPGRGMFLEGMSGFNEEIQPFHRNLTKAKEELALSKYSPDELAQYELDFGYLTGQEGDRRTIILAQANVAEIGLNAKIRGVTISRWYEDLAKPETGPHFFPLGFGPKIMDPTLYLLAFHSESKGGWAGGHFWFSDERDELIEDMLTCMDKEERIAMIKDFQKTIIEEMPVLVFAQVPWPIAMRERVKGYVHYPVDESSHICYRYTIED